MSEPSTTLSELGNILRYSGPVALVNLCQYSMHLIDLSLIGHNLPSPSLAAACLCLVIANLLQEPACFIIANAMTTLCTDAFKPPPSSHSNPSATHAALDYLKAAFIVCLLFSIPIGLLIACSPLLLSLFSLPADVLSASAIYAPWAALTVTPALIQSKLLGYLRAQRQLQSTASVCVGAVCCNLLLAVVLVPSYGLAGSVWATIATRYFSVFLLLLFHQASFPLTFLDLLFSVKTQLGELLVSLTGPGPDEKDAESRAWEHAQSGKAREHPLKAITALYVASVLPATLRIGGFQLLTLLAFPLSNDPNDSVAVALTTLLLQMSLSVCMGVQMSTVMLTTRHLYRYRFALAQRTMRLAAVPLLTFSLFVALLCWQLQQALAFPFTTDPAIHTRVATLSWYIAPMLLLKASSGLHGQYLAVSGRGVVGTYILVVVPWGLGIPVAYLWALLSGGGVITLLRVHTCAWLLTAIAFAVCYIRAVPTSRQPPSTALTAAVPQYTPAATPAPSSTRVSHPTASTRSNRSSSTRSSGMIRPGPPTPPPEDDDAGTGSQLAVPLLDESQRESRDVAGGHGPLAAVRSDKADLVSSASST